MKPPLCDQLAVLGHERRLSVFQLLMTQYPKRIAAGEIARALELKPNTTSDYLTALKAAGLIRSEREGTSQLYSVDMPGTAEFSKAFYKDCCGGRPDLCQPAAIEEGRNS